MGDFNVTMDVKFMINFWKLNDFSSLIDKPHVTKTLINLTQPVIRCSKLTRCEICSKLTIKIPERRTYFTHCSSVSIVNFEQVNAGWE